MQSRSSKSQYRLAQIIDAPSNRLRLEPRASRKRAYRHNLLHLWSGFEKHDGYGDIARNTTLAASKIVNIRVQALRHYHSQLKNELGLGSILSPHERHADGPQFSIQSVCDVLPPMGTRNALFTMHESSVLDPKWIDAINKYDLVIVPCDENAHTFRRQLRPPVEVVNIGLDHNLYSHSTYPDTPTFRFGTAGNIRHVRERKGMDRVIEWFVEAFPTNPNVSLSVKLNDGDDPIDDSDPRVEVIRENMPHEDAAGWLRSIDCYVDASTYEGWGMWPFHAMATGRPVIGTYFGGHREYFTFGNHIPIGYRVERAQSHYRHYGDWAMPIASEGVEAMRWAYSHQQECREIGNLAANSTKRFTWDKFVRNIFKMLNKHDIYHG